MCILKFCPSYIPAVYGTNINTLVIYGCADVGDIIKMSDNCRSLPLCAGSLKIDGTSVTVHGLPRAIIKTTTSTAAANQPIKLHHAHMRECVITIVLNIAPCNCVYSL